MSIAEIWQRIDGWVAANAPQARVRLLPGATVVDIQAVEAKLNIAFPEDLKSSLQIHNGQHGLATPLAPPWQLASLESIVRQWEIMQGLLADGTFAEAQAKPVGPVQAMWWHPAWIPVAYNGAGDLLCADGAPVGNGRAGQIITFWHVREQREVIAPGFARWLGGFADDLENDRYLVSGKRLVWYEP